MARPTHTCQLWKGANYQFLSWVNLFEIAVIIFLIHVLCMSFRCHFVNSGSPLSHSDGTDSCQSDWVGRSNQLLHGWACIGKNEWQTNLVWFHSRVLVIMKYKRRSTVHPTIDFDLTQGIIQGQYHDHPNSHWNTVTSDYCLRNRSLWVLGTDVLVRVDDHSCSIHTHLIH